MTSTKITALTESTAPAASDITYVVTTPGGTPASKKATLLNIAKATRPPNFLLVAASGGDYTTLSAALAAISDNDATHVYTVVVAGLIAETATITAKSYVNVMGLPGAKITITATGAGHGVVFTSLVYTTWQDLHIVRAGASTVDFVYALNVAGTSDSTVKLINLRVENTTTQTAATNHRCGLVVNGSASPYVLDCVGIGGTGGYYGMGIWVDGTASGTFTNCHGYGGGGAAYCYGFYVIAQATPLLINCLGVGGSGGVTCVGFFCRESAAPVVINMRAIGGSGGNTCHGMHFSGACAPIIQGGVATSGPGGTGNSINIIESAAPTLNGTSAFPPRVSGVKTATATTTTTFNATYQHALRSLNVEVNVAGTGGATVSIGTTLGGTEIVNALDITTTGVKVPTATTGVALDANATIYITVGGTGTPNVDIKWVVDLWVESAYAIELSSIGRVRLHNITAVGGRGYGLVINSATRTANNLLITNSHIEALGITAGYKAIYVDSAYSDVPVYNCILAGGVTNFTGASGTANGTNTVL